MEEPIRIGLFCFFIIVSLCTILSGCTPANVSLNADFGFSNGPLEKTPSELALITLTSEPSFINAANQAEFILQGICSKPLSFKVKVNETFVASTECNSLTWLVALDLSQIPDGSVKIAFYETITKTEIKQLNLQKDVLPPTAVLISNPAPLNNTSTLNQMVNSIGVAQYSYKIGLSGTTDCNLSSGYSNYRSVAEPINESLNNFGQNAIKLCLLGKDSFNNEQAYTLATTVSWMRDTVLPTASYITSTDATYVNSATKSSFNITVGCSELGQPVSIDALDALGSVTRTGVCSQNGGVLSYTANFDLSSLSDGTVSFKVTHSDAAENIFDGIVKTVLKDTVGPTLLIPGISFSQYINTNTSSPTFSWSSANDGAGGSGFSEFKIGVGSTNGSFDLINLTSKGSSTSHTFTGLALLENVPYYPILRAYDLAGNFTSEISASGWQADLTGPTISTLDDGIVSAPGESPTASWSSGTDSGSGVAYYQYAIGTSPGGQNTVSWTSNSTAITKKVFHANLLAGSTYYFSVRATDNVGNIGPIKQGDGFQVKILIATVFSNKYAHVGKQLDGKLISWGEGVSGGDNTVPTLLRTGVLETDTIASSLKAFAAKTNNGAVIAWGDPQYGGDLSGVSLQLNGAIPVTSIVNTDRAFAAIRSDGSVITWGEASMGGDSSSVSANLDGTIDVLSIKATRTAFAALRANGSVITWGSANGGNSASVASFLDGSIPVSNLFATSAAFAALHNNGSLTTWGNTTYGGDSSSVAAALAGTVITGVYSNSVAFAAVRSNGSVVTWGLSTYGGDSTAVSASINGTIPVTLIASNPYSFAALRNDGSVITWGSATEGGNSSSVSTSLNGTIDVVSIVATLGAYAAVRANGSVVVWGNAGYGANASSVSASINGTIPVTQIVASETAFAALRQNGSVITWGNATQGGDSSSVATQINGTKPIASIYSNAFSIVAKRADGTFVTWGDSTYGGDSSLVNP